MDKLQEDEGKSETLLSLKVNKEAQVKVGMRGRTRGNFGDKGGNLSAWDEDFLFVCDQC